MEANMVEDNRTLQVEYAERMTRLLANDDFKVLFSDLFIDAFAITNAYNMWSYDDNARRRMLEKTLSRSHFTRFIDEVLEDGKNATTSFREESEEAEAEPFDENTNSFENE